MVLDHGMGSRVLKMINIFSYVDYLKKNNKNYEYVHTPLKYEGFGVNFERNQHFLYHFDTVSNHYEEYLELCKIWDEVMNYNGLSIHEIQENQVIPLVHPSMFGEEETEVFNHSIKIKKIIKDNFNIKPSKINNDFNIVLHIRRGDVNKSNRDRWIDDEYYLKVIELLKIKYPDGVITINTQRKNFNYEIFKNHNIIFDDKKSNNEVWLDMINADVLVIGKSAFSYSAAILNEGLVIYPSDGMFHPKLHGWKTINEI